MTAEQQIDRALAYFTDEEHFCSFELLSGKGGVMLKRIGSLARQDIERFTGRKVFLRLFVKVREDWRDNDLTLGELGYRS